MNNREIDALVAEKVMGWGVKHFEASQNENSPVVQKLERWCVEGIDIPPEDEENDWLFGNMPWFSTNISDAWQVVEKMAKYGIAIHTPRDSEKGHMPWRVVIATDISGLAKAVNGETAPMAICLAALKAKGVEV